MPSDQEFLIALGGNVPLKGAPPENTLCQAIERLALAGAEIVSVSRFYRTPAFPLNSGPEFVNSAAMIRLEKTPLQVLEILHEIEVAFGRARRERWGQRTLDLDLLAAGANVVPDRRIYDFWRELPMSQRQEKAPDQLVLPHPRLHERAFVLVPLFDVAPDWTHPVLNRSVRQMLSDLPEDERLAVQPL